MAEQLESLLQKIHDEAVAKADAAAAARLQAAEQRAKEIEQSAEVKAAAIIAAAEQRAQQLRDSGTLALQHAARDVLLYVRQAISKYFTTLIHATVPELVPLERVQEILMRLAIETAKCGYSHEGLRVYVNEADEKALVHFFLTKFREQVKTGVELHPIKGIRAGFRFELKDNDVKFDFSDAVIVEMLSTLVNPALEAILRQAAEQQQQ
ncbi:MAG: hypothetical protein N2595_03700 [bacterium]|nr:hypothetical protein [bacterium]